MSGPSDESNQSATPIDIFLVPLHRPTANRGCDATDAEAITASSYKEEMSLSPSSESNDALSVKRLL